MSENTQRERTIFTFIEEIVEIVEPPAPACDNCLFARGYSCCAHPTTIPFPSRRWCGEHQPRRT
jgi:hypothetical protein